MLKIPDEDESWLERATIKEGNSREKWKREEFR
jgi:hypothetical protein